MADIRHLVATAVSIPLLPLLAAQGRRVRRTTVRLPPAADPASGCAGDGVPAVRLLLVGESTVAGVGAASHERALAGETAAALATAIGRAVAWCAVGENGATAACSRDVLVPRIPAGPVDAVAIALGVNDVLRLHGPDVWVRDLVRLIDAIRERVGPAPVVVAAMAPIGRFPSLPQPLRLVLGERAAALDRATARVVDLREGVSRSASRLESDERSFATDRFHPSEEGYRAWGRLLAADVAAALGTGDVPEVIVPGCVRPGTVV